jgi:hypothetical protein
MTASLTREEEEYIKNNKKSKRTGSSVHPNVKLQTYYRRVLGKSPEIHPLLHPDQPFPMRLAPLQSRWLIGPGPPEGAWKSLLEIDEYNVGYINRLYLERSEHAMLADLMDSFCRERQRLGDVLEILGSVCLYHRLIPSRTTPRELVTVHQLDAAFDMEHPGALDEMESLGADSVVNRRINEGQPLPPALDDDVEFLGSSSDDDD